MVLELLEDYLLLVTGTVVGLLISGLCHIAALSDQRIDAMEHAKAGIGVTEE